MNWGRKYSKMLLILFVFSLSFFKFSSYIYTYESVLCDILPSNFFQNFKTHVWPNGTCVRLQGFFNEFSNNSITVEMSKYCLEYAMVIWLVSHTSFSILAIQSGKSLITFLVKICHLNFYHCITKRTQQTLKIAITIIKSMHSILKMFLPSSRLPPALT